jgi:hypothetical protein
MTFSQMGMTATYEAPVSGGKVSGYVLFTPTSDLINAASGTIYKAVGVQAAINSSNGTMTSVNVIATDSTDVVPVNAIVGQEYTWLWAIQEVINGQNNETWWAEITSTMGVDSIVDLSALTRLPQPTIG